MVLNSTMNSSAPHTSKSQLIVNTSSFNGEDFRNFLNISEEIQRYEQQRQRRSVGSTKTVLKREELFECSTLDEDAFLTALEHQNSYDAEKSTKMTDLSQSIENLMHYFTEDVAVDSGKSAAQTPIKQTQQLEQSVNNKKPQSRVAAVVANFSTKKFNLTPSPLRKRKQRIPLNEISLPNIQQKLEQSDNNKKPQSRVAAVVANFSTKKFNLTPSPLRRRKQRTPLNEIARPNIEELLKKYEATEHDLGKSPKKNPKPRSKVKQMTQMFNKIMRRDSDAKKYAPLQNELSPEPKVAVKPNATFTKQRSKLPIYRSKFQSPVSSPRLKRSNKLKQNNSTLLVAEDVFRQLSVKDKALLYQKFVEDMSKQHPQFSKHAERIQEKVKQVCARGEVVNEKQVPVKHLKQEIEAKFPFPRHTISHLALQRLDSNKKGELIPKRQAPPPPATKQTEDRQTSVEYVEIGEAFDSTHVSTLTVVLKPSPDAKKNVPRSKLSPTTSKRDLLFLEALSASEPSLKRNNDQMRSTLSTEVYAPPKKIRRTRAERMAPKMFFQNQHLERLFFSWLKEKNGVAFDITAPNQKQPIEFEEAEISINSVVGENNKSTVDRLLKDAIAKLEIVDATYCIEDNKFSEKEVDTTSKTIERAAVEISIPLEVQIPSSVIEVQKVTAAAAAAVRPPVPTPRKSKPISQKVPETAVASSFEKRENISAAAPNTPYRAQQTTPAPTTPRSVLQEVAAEVPPTSHNELQEAVHPTAARIMQQRIERISVSSASSVFPSDAGESESGLSTLPKITTDDSQTEQNTNRRLLHNQQEFSFVKPDKPPRKKKMRRTLTWKKENSIVEAMPLQTTTTDSDSDVKQITENSKKFLQTAAKQKKSSPNSKKLVFNPQPLVETPTAPTQETSLVELDELLLRQMNSPRKVKTAYTLTVMSSPSPNTESDLCDSEQLRTPCRETSRSWPSVVDAVQEKFEQLELSKAASTDESTKRHIKTEPHTLIDSYIDQGFETGSNEMDSPVRLSSRIHATEVLKQDNSPLFIKLTSELENTRTRRLSSSSVNNQSNENPMNFSTPVKGHATPPRSFTAPNNVQQQLFSPIQSTAQRARRRASDVAESRRSSFTMPAIREGQPLDHDTAGSPRSSSVSGSAFVPNTNATTANIEGYNTEQVSRFWITAGDFTISTDIFYSTPDRLRLLYDIFSQKSFETRDLHFGIDDHKFSKHHPADKEEISNRLPRMKGCSHYWFSTGDLAVPFSGKYMTADKVKRMFNFISEAIEESGTLRFGVDAFEFSNIPEFWHNSPKYSIESSYSMLVGLQGGNSNGLEGRSKYAWPSTMTTSMNSNLIKTSDLDHSEFDSEEFENSDLRLSFSPFGDNHFDLASLGSDDLTTRRNSDAMMSPEMFSLEYENESLDQLFADVKYTRNEKLNESRGKRLTVPQMLETLQNQQSKLKSVEKRIRSYAKPTNLSSDALEQFKDSPEYIRKLQGIIAAIDDIGRESGFRSCTLQQLESFMFFLSRYADICLANCSDHMDKILDALMDQRAVQV